MRVVVHIVGYLVHAGQRVQDLHVGPCLFQHRGPQDVHVLHAFIFHEVGEAFALYAGHIQYVGAGDDVGVEVLVFHIAYVLFAAVGFVLLGHGQLLGCNEVEGRVEVAHGHQQRVYGAAIFQVANQVDVQVVEPALRLVYAVEVEHRLRGVLVGTVSGVHHRHRRHLAGIAGRSFQIVAHDNHVGIVAHHHDGVFQRFAFGRAGHLGVSKSDDTGTEAVGSRFKREAGAC